ncbi:MAG TPA: hypothetical protein VL985_20295 [Stellaceae bacterium]|nr:hypothetical protein [Stellaceae bacterium]
MIERVALISLLVGCAAFAGILAAELIATTPAAQTEAAAGGASVRATPRLASAPQPEASARLDTMVAEILARPLFSSTRRPPSEDRPVADTGLSDTRLTGILIEPGHRFAIFAPTGDKPLMVSEGDMVSGWRVENITPRNVSLSGPEGTQTLEPKIDPNLAPPAPRPGSVPAATPFRPAAVSLPRPGLPPAFLNRPPLRPGLRRER